MDDALKDLLDGNGKAKTSRTGCDVIATREDACPLHGPYTAQQIRLRPSRVLYWLPCPNCQAQWDKQVAEEAKGWKRLIPADPRP
jgi:hypothetical protein